jgi:hypothetical protein
VPGPRGEVISEASAALSVENTPDTTAALRATDHALHATSCAKDGPVHGFVATVGVCAPCGPKTPLKPFAQAAGAGIAKSVAVFTPVAASVPVLSGATLSVVAAALHAYAWSPLAARKTAFAAVLAVVGHRAGSAEALILGRALSIWRQTDNTIYNLVVDAATGAHLLVAQSKVITAARAIVAKVS